MPRPETVAEFVAVVESGDYVGAIERFYHPDATTQENEQAPRLGRDAAIQNERAVMAAFDAITARKIGSALIDNDTVAIRWAFEFTGKEGKRFALDEIAWQTWRGDKIVAEKFYYDPKQLGR